MGNSQAEGPAAPVESAQETAAANGKDSSSSSGSSMTSGIDPALLLALVRMLADKKAEGEQIAAGGASESKQRMITENDSLHELYEEKRYLARGGFGTVVKGKHFLDQCFYAIKIIGFDQRELETVVREARSLASLQTHPHIVAYKGCWIERSDKTSDDGLKEKLMDMRIRTHGRKVLPDMFLCVRMECCTGNLDDYLDRRNDKFFANEEYKSDSSLRDGRAFPDKLHRNNKAIFVDILKGLTFLHEKKIIHRDLKPANILYQRESMDFKITDFGLAKYYDSMDQRMTLCGTPMYSAPEQITKRHYDQSVDVYSLGLLLFDMLYPFKNMAEHAEMFEKLKSKPNILPLGLRRKHPSLAQLIIKMTNEKADDRPSLERLMTLDWNTA